MSINTREFLSDLSLLYAYMGQGKSNTVTNVFSYYYDDAISYYAVTNGSMIAILEKQLNRNLPKQAFKCDGNLLFQTIKGIKSEEIDIFIPYDSTLRIHSCDVNNDIEVDLALLNTTNGCDYIMKATDYYDRLDNQEILMHNYFVEALKTCSPYISTNDGKLSYIYFYGKKAVSANNNFNSEIAIYNSFAMYPFPRMFISKKDAEIIAKTKIEWNSFRQCGDYYRIGGDTANGDELYVFLNALNEKENYPVIIDTDRYSKEQLNASSYYTVEALEKQNNAEEVKFNKNELKELLDAVTVNDIPNLSLLTISGNTIKYEVRYPRIKKSKTIKVKETYPYIKLKLNPSVLKNALEIGSEYLSIDKSKIVVKTDWITYICFIGE